MQNFITGIFTLGAIVAIIGGVLGLIAPSVFRIGQMKENPSRKRIGAISFAAFIMSCVGVGVTAPEPTPEEKAVQAAAAKAQATSSPDAAVISTSEGHNIRRIKRSVVVRLSREISYSDLVALGKSIRDQDSNYERVFIEYYLPGMRENAGAWAITHWTPNLEARILGNVQRFDHLSEADARKAQVEEYLQEPDVAELLNNADFMERELAGWAAVSCKGVKGTDALYGPFRATTGRKGEIWAAASHVAMERFEQAERDGKPFDCSVVGKFLEKGWLVKVE